MTFGHLLAKEICKSQSIRTRFADFIFGIIINLSLAMRYPKSEKFHIAISLVRLSYSYGYSYPTFDWFINQAITDTPCSAEVTVFLCKKNDV